MFFKYISLDDFKDKHYEAEGYVCKDGCRDTSEEEGIISEAHEKISASKYAPKVYCSCQCPEKDDGQNMYKTVDQKGVLLIARVPKVNGAKGDRRYAGKEGDGKDTLGSKDAIGTPQEPYVPNSKARDHQNGCVAKKGFKAFKI